MVSLAPLCRARRTARSKAGCTEAVASTSTRMLLKGSIRSPFLWPRFHEMRDTHDLLDRQDERNATPGVVQFRRPSAELLRALARRGTARGRWEVAKVWDTIFPLVDPAPRPPWLWAFPTGGKVSGKFPSPRGRLR